jgi:sugar O-acyltransferase (sialic acid O-acetyltransferase NeuD family)
MPALSRIVILGTGGNSIDILDLIQDLNEADDRAPYECVGFLDDNRAIWGSTLHGVPVRGPLSLAAELADCTFVNGIGSPESFRHKPSLIASAGVATERFTTLVHPTAVVSRSARLGSGVVLFPHVTVGSNARIGHHVIVLPNSVISHDDGIGDFTCIAGGVAVSGGVRIGRSCYVGTGSQIIGGIEIGDGALVGMGSVVIRSVARNAVVAGNPAREIRGTTGVKMTASAALATQDDR